MSAGERPPCVGILGGLGVGATIHYYQSIVSACTAQARPFELLIAHADVRRVLGYVANGQINALASYLAAFAEDLADAGADFGAIAALTPHICFAEIAQRTRLPLISGIDPAVRDIQARMVRRVTLFGTRSTIESRLFGSLRDVEVIRPTAEEIDFIHNTYVGIVDAGHASIKQMDGLRALAHALWRREKLDALVLAGTEFSLVFNASNMEFPAVDCAQLHIRAIVQALAGNHISQVGS